ncbi:MAG: (2Fe-2S)-binding protein [Planctomycetes bacterium]|nr:(2Fe-2S)-binding protein [Planctomycetota bacterium]
MPKIIIDGKEIQCRDGVAVLQAALDAGIEVPHYCYHPGLSIVASCRLCLMEMKMPHPQTKEMAWAPKLFPSCQTPVKDGLEVRFASQPVKQNQQHVMEYYLLNHPLDCPVCDKAGECYLQDYSERYGTGASRMVEEKYKNPKKDIGSHTLLYQDRCVLCTRCVRFCNEIAGSGELAVVERGSRGEIDVFPGVPLENPLQGNVVDLCPVGCLIDKEFLFKQSVWLLEGHDSVCPGCARGCSIVVDESDNRVRRLRPRFNEKVNEWWMCDEGRFGWKYVERNDRLNRPRQRQHAGGAWSNLRWEDAADEIRSRISAVPGAAVAAVLSPMMSCEEAWLLATFVRTAAPDAALVGGFVPQRGQDQRFPRGFTILAEKCPNRRGIERILSGAGGDCIGFDEFLRRAADGRYRAAIVTGGYPQPWISDAGAAAMGKIGTLIVHDLFGSPLDGAAAIQIPGAAWTEREGSFINVDRVLQTFNRACRPIDGVKTDGQLWHELEGQSGLYRACRTRERMAALMPEFATPFAPREEPEYAH